MKTHPPQHAFERKLLALAEGYRNLFEPTVTLTFPTETFHPEQVIWRLHQMTDAIQAERVAKARHAEAVATTARLLPGSRVFYDQAAGVAKTHHGSDPRKMAAMCLTTPRRPSPPASRRKPERCAPESTCGEQVTTREEEEVVIVVEETTREVGAPECEKPPACEKPPKRGRKGRGRRC